MMAHADTLRRYFPAVQQQVYLNTGSNGALPESSIQAMQSVLEYLLHNGRKNTVYTREVQRVSSTIKEMLGQMLDVPSHSLALTESTTHGINIILWGIALQPGDEIIVSDLEHEGVLLPLFVQRDRRGVVIKRFSTAGRKEDWLPSLTRMITPRTRMIVVSHVTHLMGKRLPVEEISKIAHDHGIYLLVDGAQGVGAERVSLRQMGCDFYVFPGHKWLCGPDATGALYIRPDLQIEMFQTFVSSSSLAGSSAQSFSADGSYLWAEGAARFEHLHADLLRLSGLLESLKVIHIQAGLDFIQARIAGLTSRFMDGLLELPEWQILTPRDARAGLIHVRLPRNVSLDALQQMFHQRDIDVKLYAKERVLRVAPSFYNNEDDVDRFLHALFEFTESK